MTVSLDFAGWFQCRLAVDPDPADEPRGVSGYVHALAGEPDLDRVIRLQPHGTVHRPFCPDVGVTVRSVLVDGEPQPGHPLVGADVHLLDDPVFEGRNGIVADDGFEPIVPFHLQVTRGDFRLRRRHLDTEVFPFPQLQGTGVQPGLTDIVQATGISDLADVWRARKTVVDRALQEATDDVARTALEARSALLTNIGLSRSFAFRMLYSLELRGSGDCRDPDSFLPGDATFAAPWLVDCWLGGWDADALSGYMKGTLQVEVAGAPSTAQRPSQAAADAPFAPLPTPPRRPRRP